MTALVDTSILIDYLRGHQPAAELLEHERSKAAMHASEMTHLEILAGLRPAEEQRTRTLLSVLVWHALDEEVAEQADIPGRTWQPSHHTIDAADLTIAATAIRQNARRPT